MIQASRVANSVNIGPLITPQSSPQSQADAGQ